MCDLRFISLDSPGIIEVKFNIRSNFVGGTGVKVGPGLASQ